MTIALYVAACDTAAVSMHITLHIAFNLNIAVECMHTLGVTRDGNSVAILNLKPFDVALYGDVDGFLSRGQLFHLCTVSNNLAVNDGDCTAFDSGHFTVAADNDWHSYLLS